MMYSSTNKQRSSPAKSDGAVTTTQAASPVLSAASLLSMQRMSGNQAVQRMLAAARGSQPPSQPIQRFKDGTDDVDISALTDPAKVHHYLLKKSELSISGGEEAQLLDKYKELIGAITDPNLLIGYLEKKAEDKLIAEEIVALEDQFRTLIPVMDAISLNTYITKKVIDSVPIVLAMEARLEKLKYDKGMEVEAEENNWGPDYLTTRSDFFNRLNTSGAKYPAYSKRADYPKKRKTLDDEIQTGLTRRGSVVMDLEGKYDEKESEHRKKRFRKSDKDYQSTLRNAMKKLDNAHADAMPGAKEAEGTKFYKEDLSIYENEGIVGIYSELGSLGPPDFFEYDHQPQSDIIVAASKLKVSKGKKIQDIAQKHSQGGLTIVLEHSRHAAGASYGKPYPKKDELSKIDALPESDDKKIEKIKKMLVEATLSDAAEMEDVYSDLSSYPDIDLREPDPDKAKKLKEKIRDRVLKGEGRMKAQTFESWFK